MTRVAVVHPATIVGNELRQLFEAPAAAGWQISLHATSEDAIGQVTDVAGAAAFVGRADETALDGVDLAFLCGPIEDDRVVASHLPPGAAAIFLAPGAGPDEGPPAVAGLQLPSRADCRRLVSPHPAAVALSLLIAPLEAFGVRRAAATLALPVTADEDGSIDELFEETKRLLTFQSPTPRSRKQGQVAFNLTPDDALSSAVEAATAGVLGDQIPVAVQILRAGVFHGLAVQLWIELEQSPTPQQVRKRLGEAPAIELARKTTAVGPVTAAGKDRLLVGAVRSGSDAHSFGIWAAMDNLLRGVALNALELGIELLEARPPS